MEIRTQKTIKSPFLLKIRENPVAASLFSLISELSNWSTLFPVSDFENHATHWIACRPTIPINGTAFRLPADNR